MCSLTSLDKRVITVGGTDGTEEQWPHWADFPVLLPCPLLAGKSSPSAAPEQVAAGALRSRSLPALPASSPRIKPRKLTGSLGCSIDKLQSFVEDGVASQPEKWSPLRSSETLEKTKQDAFISSCESAKTVCETEAALSAQASVSDAPKGALELPAVNIDQKDFGAEPRSDDDSPGDESCPRRPLYLKGLASFQRSHSTIASLGLAFPSQNGSAAVGRWPSLVDRNTDDWENFALSLGYEPRHSRTTGAHRYMCFCMTTTSSLFLNCSLKNFCTCRNLFILWSLYSVT